MSRKSGAGALLLGCLIYLALFAFLISLGPMAFAYDLNHLVPLATHQPLAVKWTNLAIFIAGVFLSEIAIPVALIVWVLVTIGVLS